MTLSEQLEQMKDSMRFDGKAARTNFAQPIRRHKFSRGSGVVAGSTFCKQFKWPAKSMRSFG